jgi:HAD superfamily hydrolase (TIGR01493 family)
MKKAKNVKIISLDLFRTIIDIEPSPGTLWHKFLEENFSSKILKNYVQITNEIDNKKWDAAGIDDKQFKNVRTVLEETAAELFGEINLDYGPKLAANTIIDAHKIHNTFQDVQPFLHSLGHKYPVCLSTDADFDMLENISDIYPFNNRFISEELQAYKPNPRFFKHLLNHYKVKPENILHIGDSKYDIIAPKGLGIQTCWLNRNNNQWDHAVKPDFEVKSLLEIPDLLD